VVLPMTSVWPALWPPWKRTTISARSDNQSTILPLPSSPHWAPTTVTLAILSSVNQAVATGAAFASTWVQTRLSASGAGSAGGWGRVGRGSERCELDPALGAPGGSIARRGAPWQKQAARGRGIGQRTQQRVEIEREAGRRLAAAGSHRLAGEIAPAAAELAAH